MAAEERKAHKDYFDQDAARMMASQISAVTDKFDRRKFIKVATADLESMEFAARVSQFAAALAEALPASKPAALKILTRSLPPALPNCDSVTDGWLQWPVGQFIADYGVDHYKESMTAMIALTQRFSSEYAVGPFVERYQDVIFRDFMKLTTHKSPHVRRWCSEGIRTRLPWRFKLKKLIEDPSPIWPILDKLKDDPELYVRRSVANNVNDIAKDHPDQVIRHLKKWSVKSNPDRDWVIKHGLRSLIKDGNPQALALQGVKPPKNIQSTLTAKPKSIKIGESVELTATLNSTSKTRQKLLIDFVVGYPRKNGKTSDKVFKWTSVTLAGGDNLTLHKKLPMRVTTVRALYPGTHHVRLQINGVDGGKTSFKLGKAQS